MREYFNAEERENHIKVTSCKLYAEKLADSPAITAEEKKLLKDAAKKLDKATDSIFQRFGEAYIRKLQGVMINNKLMLVGRYAPTQQAVSQVASADILPMVRNVQEMTCWECEKCNFRDCAMYNFGIACDLQDIAEEGCPFKL